MDPIDQYINKPGDVKVPSLKDLVILAKFIKVGNTIQAHTLLASLHLYNFMIVENRGIESVMLYAPGSKPVYGVTRMRKGESIGDQVKRPKNSVFEWIPPSE